MNYKIKIMYDGSAYNGWQRQKNTDKTIQGILETSISLILGENIQLYGSGRTDAGVHAKGQIANFHTKVVVSLKQMQNSLNLMLPEDIKVLQLNAIDAKFHARRSAVKKRYSYSIWNSYISPVFERKYLYERVEKLDLNAMREASKYLVGEHDFRSFCSNRTFEKSTIRTIYSIDIEKTGDKIVIFYEGSGFLYNMVRILSGTLIEIGLGSRKPNSISALLEAKKRELAGFCAPPQGLCLDHVFYENQWEEENNAIFRGDREES
ncbi:MAG: tRNA pseudouridine(38-40) synthase TruA [Velocimicrobium sp.]